MSDKLKDRKLARDALRTRIVGTDSFRREVEWFCLATVVSLELEVEDTEPYARATVTSGGTTRTLEHIDLDDRDAPLDHDAVAAIIREADVRHPDDTKMLKDLLRRAVRQDWQRLKDVIDRERRDPKRVRAAYQAAGERLTAEVRARVLEYHDELDARQLFEALRRRRGDTPDESIEVSTIAGRIAGDMDIAGFSAERASREYDEASCQLILEE